MAAGQPLRCLMCHRPFELNDVNVTPHSIIFTCRNCEAQRITPRNNIKSIYGESGNRLDALVDQARRLEG